MSVGIFIVADSQYILPARCLVHSLNKHNCLSSVPIYIITQDVALSAVPFVENDIEGLIVIDKKRYSTASKKEPRLIESYKKLEAFNDFGFDRNLVIDADIICTGSIDLLLNCDSLMGDFIAAPDNGYGFAANLDGHLTINSGVFVVNKPLQSDIIRKEIVSHIGQSDPHGEQSAINKWLRHSNVSLGYLPMSYNLQVKAINSGYWEQEYPQCKLLHWSGEDKPWNKNVPLMEKWDEIRSEI